MTGPDPQVKTALFPTPDILNYDNLTVFDNATRHVSAKPFFHAVPDEPPSILIKHPGVEKSLVQGVKQEI